MKFGKIECTKKTKYFSFAFQNNTVRFISSIFLFLFYKYTSKVSKFFNTLKMGIRSLIPTFFIYVLKNRNKKKNHLIFVFLFIYTQQTYAYKNIYRNVCKHNYVVFWFFFSYAWYIETCELNFGAIDNGKIRIFLQVLKNLSIV